MGDSTPIVFDQKELDGKRVLVTGGTKGGIGEALPTLSVPSIQLTAELSAQYKGSPLPLDFHFSLDVGKIKTLNITLAGG